MHPKAVRIAKVIAAASCALLATLAASCGGGGGGNTTPPPPPTVSIVIAPGSATVGFGSTKQFSATVTGSTNTAVTWSAADSSGGTSKVGTISSAGLYTAPTATSAGTPAAPQTVFVTAGHATSASVSVPELNRVNFVTVTATSQADPTKSAAAAVTLTGLVIRAVGQCTQSGTSLSCSAGATGTAFSRGQSGYLFIAGYGIEPGTQYYISGNDVTPDSTLPLQPPSANFQTANDGTPVVYFQIVVSPTAALGPRNVVVTNPGGELAAFPGGLQITP